jgi:signal transduction histidine kinase
MSPFQVGFAAGVLCTLLLALGAAIYAYHRLVLLERRTRNAERLAELGALTGGLAHEIKNPLSTVQLNLQLLKEDLDPHNPAYGRVISRLDTVHREASRLRDILDDFLRFAGRIELAPRPVELNGMLQELVDFFAPQAQLHRVQLRLKRHPADVIAPVDARLMKQAVLNLMINAVQAMQEGGELILSLAIRGRSAEIEVIDTGPGITPEEQQRIFRAYYTTKRGGTGIGLAMAKRVAEEHGGSISLRSEVGKGSDFTIHVPLQANR